jgi:hypothetical protein
MWLVLFLNETIDNVVRLWSAVHSAESAERAANLCSTQHYRCWAVEAVVYRGQAMPVRQWEWDKEKV